MTSSRPSRLHARTSSLGTVVGIALVLFMRGLLGFLLINARALEQHFFTGGDARPVLSSLQNRNRILIQARVLIDAGDLRAPGPYGFDKAAWARAQGTYANHFGGDAEKSAYNLFTQNQWYAGKLVSTGKLPSLRRLIDNQQEFIAAFEEIIRRPNDQEAVLREMAVRCLT